LLALKARVLLLGAVFIAAAISASARAQDYPTRPVEIIVPFAAGGGSDLDPTSTTRTRPRRP
jgi:tripartite-type tricarboxylate transporter receptor subunit TctC